MRRSLYPRFKSLPRRSLLLLGIVLFELVIQPQLWWRWINPDWWLLVLIFLALARSPWLGMELAFGWGLVADALRTETLGVYALSYAAVVFALGYVEPSRLSDPSQRRSVVALLLLLALGVQLLLRYGFGLPLEWGLYLSRTLIAYGLWLVLEALMQRVAER